MSVVIRCGFKAHTHPQHYAHEVNTLLLSSSSLFSPRKLMQSALRYGHFTALRLQQTESLE